MSNWYSESSPLERRTFWASFGGWALDALDVQMFGLAIPALIAAFGISKADAEGSLKSHAFAPCLATKAQS